MYCWKRKLVYKCLVLIQLIPIDSYTVLSANIVCAVLFLIIKNYMFAVKQKYLETLKRIEFSKHLTTFVAFMPFASLKRYKKKLPIWKTIALTIHANTVVYTAANMPHFQLPVSPLMAAMVATHGK